MDLLLLLKAAVMGIVEGITEFLPISSTGHLMLSADVMNFWQDEQKLIVFVAVIQIGAILAVIFEYWSKLWGTAKGMITGDPQSRRLGLGLIFSSIPIVIAGLTLDNWIESILSSNILIAISLIVGGLIIWWIEKHPPKVKVQEVDDLTIKQSIWIGLIQVLSLIPGTSRSGATIIGAMFLGVSRKAATEYSFFLGLPVLIGAGALAFLKDKEVFITGQDWAVLGMGIAVSFISALIFIRALVAYVAKRDFMIFAYYRILSGIIILIISLTGWQFW
ncbi:MAG: undecaprenyl-diphosphate phosphatase [Acinetobacter sp.]|nr:undecaprenyl-diphosphate phosphatase [Acinetobacter sp.]